MTSKHSHHILRGAKVEDTQFLDPQSIQKKITDSDHALPTSNDEDLSKQEMISLEKLAYQKGLQDGQNQGYQTGYEQGIEHGLKKGTAVAHDEFKDTISMLNIIAMAFLVRKEELFEQLKPEIIKLCLVLCRKLLQRELSDPESFKELIFKLLDQIKAISKELPIDILISKHDYTLIQSKLDSIELTFKDMPKIHLSIDSFLEKGNCRLESSIGMLNFDIQRMLEDLETKMLET